MKDHRQPPISQPDARASKPRATPPASLEDPKAFQSFLHSLQKQIEPRITSELDEDVQVEIVQVNRLLLETPPKIVDLYRSQFELLYKLVGATPTNAELVRGLRLNLVSAISGQKRGISRIFRVLCGRTPLMAVFSALLTMFAVLLISSFILFELHSRGLAGSAEMAESYYLILMIKNAPLGSLMVIVHAAFFGSVISVLARVPSFLSLVAFDPRLIYFSTLTRPLIAITFSIFVFSVIKAGFLSTLGTDLDGPSGDYFLFAIGFLCGFSERFAKDIIERTRGPLGG